MITNNKDLLAHVIRPRNTDENGPPFLGAAVRDNRSDATGERQYLHVGLSTTQYDASNHKKKKKKHNNIVVDET